MKQTIQQALHHPRHLGLMLGLTLLSLSSSAGSVLAQAADIPRADRNGDFRTARVRGNRGDYPHRHWLVVDRGAGGLNCRAANGEVMLTLNYGSVINSRFEGGAGYENDTGEAIDLVNGQPWLSVEVTAFDIRQQVTSELAEKYQCYVRANQRFIAPINPSSLEDQV